MAGILIGVDVTRGRNAQHPEEHIVPHQWIPAGRRERLVQSSYSEILMKHWRLYCNHTSLVGIKCYVNSKATMFGRILWILIFGTIVFYGSAIIFTFHQEYSNSPIVTTQEDIQTVDNKLQFPGVAICSINRISRRVAMDLAAQMYDAKISNLTKEKILWQILDLGDLYESPIIPENDYSLIDGLLSKFYPNGYSITDLLKSLTPQCSDMFLDCYFDNKQQNCSEMFKLTKTRNGFCCTFNYFLRPENEFDNETDVSETYSASYVGIPFGLSVTVEPFLDDYIYPVLPITGWKVMIFNPENYPDPNSGNVDEVLVAPSTQQDIEVLLVTLTSTEDIRKYAIEKRRCIFEDEMFLFTKTPYSFNKCIVDCKMTDIWRNCKCRPFYYPRFYGSEGARRTCSFDDIKCLLNYYSRKVNVIPYEDKELSEAIPNNEEALVCKYCYPECNNQDYSTRTSSSVLQSTYFQRTVLNKTDDASIIRVYLAKTEHPRFKQDKHIRWYEHLSDIGGMCSLFIGFSVISLVEIVYFLGLCLWEMFEFSLRKKKISKQIKPRFVYWNEYFPRPRN